MGAACGACQKGESKQIRCDHSDSITNRAVPEIVATPKSTGQTALLPVQPTPGDGLGRGSNVEVASIMPYFPTESARIITEEPGTVPYARSSRGAIPLFTA